jgi:hypothetical protein
MRGGNLICFQSEKPGSIAFQRSFKLQALSHELMSGRVGDFGVRIDGRRIATL